jgi:hypothetical protein
MPKRPALALSPLPTAIVLEIMAVLDLPDRLVARLVCSAWRSLLVPVRRVHTNLIPRNELDEIDLERMLGVQPASVQFLNIHMSKRIVTSTPLSRLTRLSVVSLGGEPRSQNWPSLLANPDAQVELYLEQNVELPPLVQRRLLKLQLQATALSSAWFLPSLREVRFFWVRDVPWSIMPQVVKRFGAALLRARWIAFLSCTSCVGTCAAHSKTFWLARRDCKS